jgi:hypothetical protein
MMNEPLMNQDSNRMAMLVVSCDRYADLWEPCLQLLDRYWPERNFDVYLMTNSLEFEWPGVKVIHVGDDVSYADNLRTAIAQIPEDWILLWLEDLLLCSPVNNRRVMSIIGAAQRRGAGYLKLSGDMPLSYDSGTSEEVGPLPKGVRYRAAIGASLYHRPTLERLLVPGASAWDLDRSNVCDDLPEDFLALTVASAKRPPVPYVNAVIKGRWSFGTMSFMKSEGLGAHIGKRRRESITSLAYRKMFVFRLALLRSLRVHWR